MTQLPTFLIVGAHKSGTSSLAYYLQKHPQVFMPNKKELHYFNSDENYTKGLSWYSSFFQTNKKVSAIGEATPGYMMSEEALRRMKDLLPETKLIVILRNPVDRAYSHYWMNRYRKKDIAKFEESILKEPFRSQYLGTGNYIAHIKKILAHFPESSVKTVLFEEMVASPVRVFDEVCDFIGVDQHKVDDVGKQVNPALQFRSLRFRNLYRRIPVRIVKNILGKLNVAHMGYPAMNESTRSELLSYFEPSISELEQWWGKDLSVWRE